MFSLFSKILSKQFNTDSTQVTYQIQVERYKPAQCGWNGHQSDTISETYSNLDSLCATLYPVNGSTPALGYSSCVGFYNNNITFTEIPNGYNQHTLFKAIALGLSGQDTIARRAQQLAEGLGIVMDTSLQIYACASRAELVYSQKGTDTFGTPITILQTGINTLPTFNVMTVGDVYNYDVGDVFQSSYGGTSNGWAHENALTRRVVAKRTAANSVEYDIRHIDKVIRNEEDPSKEGDINRWTETVGYNNLSQPILAAETICVGSIDSTFFCNREVLRFNYAPSSGVYRTTTYIKGCGAYTTGSALSDNYYNRLTYFCKKVSKEECGDKIDSPPTTPEPALLWAFYDNTTGDLTVHFPAVPVWQHLRIFDIMGREIFHTVLRTFTSEYTIPDFHPGVGVCVISVQTDDTKMVTKVVIPKN